MTSFSRDFKHSYSLENKETEKIIRIIRINFFINIHLYKNKKRQLDRK